MSRYSHLPIYISAMDLLRELYKRVPKFNKQYKYFLGGELMKHSTKIVSLIMDINNEKDKSFGLRKYFCGKLSKTGKFNINDLFSKTVLK